MRFILGVTIPDRRVGRLTAERGKRGLQIWAWVWPCGNKVEAADVFVGLLTPCDLKKVFVHVYCDDDSF